MPSKKNSKITRKKKYQANEPDLTRRLLLVITAIIVLISSIAIAAIKFAPQIGALFGLISVHRDDTNTPISATLPPPIFVDTLEATNTDQIRLKGLSRAGTTIKLFVNGPEKESTLTDDNGEFIFTNVELIDGKNTIFAKAFDQNNEESSKSQIIAITVDKTKPKIEIASPKDGETVKNLNKRVLVKGSVDKKAFIKINGKTAVLKPNLSFEFLLGVEEGNVEIEIQATDIAGNTKEEKLTIKYEKKGS